MMLHKNKEEYMNFVTREVQLLGFDKSPLGTPMLEYISAVYDMSNGDKTLFSNLTSMLDRLVHELPLSELKDPETSKEDWYTDGANVISKRYPPVRIIENYRILDDHGVAYTNGDNNNVYYDASSTREITLPYYPNPDLINVDKSNDQ